MFLSIPYLLVALDKSICLMNACKCMNECKSTYSVDARFIVEEHVVLKLICFITWLVERIWQVSLHFLKEWYLIKHPRVTIQIQWKCILSCTGFAGLHTWHLWPIYLKNDKPFNYSPWWVSMPWEFMSLSFSSHSILSHK